MRLHESLLLNTSVLINFDLVFSMYITSSSVPTFIKNTSLFYQASSSKAFIELTTGNIVANNLTFLLERLQDLDLTYTRIHRISTDNTDSRRYAARHAKDRKRAEENVQAEKARLEPFKSASQPLFHHSITLKSASNEENVEFYSLAELTHAEIISQLRSTISIPKERHALYKIQ